MAGGMERRKRRGKWKVYMIFWIAIGIGWIVMLPARDGLQWASFLLGEAAVVLGILNCVVQIRRERREARKETQQ